MKLRRILTGAAIGAATAIAFRSFVIWALPWQWDWHANGDLVRAFSAWAACAGAMFGAICPLSNRGRA